MINIITSELPMIWKFVKSAIDLLAVWVLLYYGIMMFKTNMRTMQLFKGVIVVLLVKAITSVLGLVTLGTIVDAVITWGVLAIVVIFQPEIRVLLEKMGQTKNEVQSIVYRMMKENVLWMNLLNLLQLCLRIKQAH